MPNPDVNTGAAPSAVQDQPQEFDLSTLSEAEHHAWRMTGDLPKRDGQPESRNSATAKPNKQDSAPATDDQPEGEPESAAEPGAATRKQKPEFAHGPKLSAEDEIRKLESRIAKIRKEAGIAEAPKAETKTDPAPVKQAEQKTEQPKALEPPKKPNLEEYIKAGKKIEEYEDDLDKYHTDNTRYEIQKALLEHQQRQELHAAARKAQEQWNETAKRYPDLGDVIVPFGKELANADPLVQNAINRSDVFHDLLYVIASKPEDRAAFLKEAKDDPVAAIERIAITSRLIKQELSKGSGESKETPRGEDGKFQKASETKVTKAPPPAPEVNSNNSAPGDESEEALKGDNVRAYIEAENAKALRTKRRY